MSIDLNGLSAKELDALINQAKKRKTTLTKRKPIATVRSKLTALAEGRGLHDRRTVRRQDGEGHRRAQDRARRRRRAASWARSRRSTAIPPIPAETWSGRGKQPRWLAALVAEGQEARGFPDQEGMTRTPALAGVFVRERTWARLLFCNAAKKHKQSRPGALLQISRAGNSRLPNSSPATSASRILSTASTASWPAATSCCWIRVMHAAQAGAAGHQHDDAGHAHDRAGPVAPSAHRRCRPRSAPAPPGRCRPGCRRRLPAEARDQVTADRRQPSPSGNRGGCARNSTANANAASTSAPHSTQSGCGRDARTCGSQAEQLRQVQRDHACRWSA